MTSSTPSTKDDFLTHKDGKVVIPIHYGTHEFTDRCLLILDYTQDLLSKNTPRGVHLTQEDVNWFFEGNVKSVYPRDHDRRSWLLQQRRCPLIMSFWETRTNPHEALLRKSNLVATTNFRPVPPPDEYGVTSICSMFMSDGREEIEVLDINILALYMVYYVQTARLIHEVNGREGLGEWTMRRIWRGIVMNVFHFECECKKAKKLEEVESEEAGKYWRELEEEDLLLVGEGDDDAGVIVGDGIEHTGGEVEKPVGITTQVGMGAQYQAGDGGKGKGPRQPWAAVLPQRFQGMERMLGH